MSIQSKFTMEAVTRQSRVLLAGFIISFLGSLPLGTMNIAATHIAIRQGTGAGLLYAVGSMLVEIIVVRTALAAMGWLAQRQRVFRLLELFTTGLILAMAIASFAAAYKMTGFSSSLPAVFSLHPFWTGVLLSATNPLHIPFWLGWSTVLMNKKILLPESSCYHPYIAGIGAGTMLGFAVFIYGGNYVVSKIAHHQDLLNMAIGTVLLVTAIIQIRKMMIMSVAVRYNGAGNNMK